MGMDYSNLIQSESHSAPENRVYSRHSEQLIASLFDRKGDPLLSHTLVMDLSPHGLCLNSPLELRVADSVLFQLSLPKGRRIKGKGRVRWAKNAGVTNLYGLEFVQLGILGRHHLKKHLAERHLDLLKTIDLSLQFASIATALFLLQDILRTNIALRSALADALPLWAMPASAVLGIFIYLKNRR